MKRVERRVLDWSLIKQSYKDLYHAHKPKNIDKFTQWFLDKYKIPRDYAEQLKKLV